MKEMTLSSSLSLLFSPSFSSFSVLFLACTACAVFFPFFTGVALDTKRDEYAVDSETVTRVYSIMLALSTVFSVNGIIDICYGAHSIKLSLPPLLMEILVALSSLIYLLLSTQINSERKLVLQICIASFQNIVIMTPLVYYMLGDKADSSERKLRFVMVPLAVMAQFSAYPFAQNHVHVATLTSVISIIFTIGSLVLGLRGFYLHFFKKICFSGEHEVDDKNGFTTLVFHAIWIFFVFGLFLIHYAGGQKDWPDQSPNLMASFCYLQICTICAVNSLPYRMVFHHAIVEKHQLEAKKNFVRYISHEIRTPLNVVLVGLQMLKKMEEGKEADTIQQQHITPEPTEKSPIMSITDDSLEACYVAVNILNELLIFDRIEEGGFHLDAKEIAIGGVIQAATKLFDVQARAAGVSLQYVDPVSTTVGTPLVLIDVNKFSQVLRNLINNAIKFTLPGGHVTVSSKFEPRGATALGVAKCKVHTEQEVEEGTVILQVCDSGHGISKENQAKLFTNILQFDPATLQGGGGTGLGLWLSHKIVEHHHGTLRVHSEGEGHGTTMTVELPAKRFLTTDAANVAYDNMISEMESQNIQSLQVQPSESSIVSPYDSDKELNLGTLLFAEDVKLNRKMVKKSLNASFTEIIEAENGQIAVDLMKDLLAKATPPDVCLMDHQMPVLTGGEAVVKFREMGYTGRVLMLTGHALPEDYERFKAMGADGVLTKPIDLKDMLRALQDCATTDAGSEHYVSHEASTRMPQKYFKELESDRGSKSNSSPAGSRSRSLNGSEDSRSRNNSTSFSFRIPQRDAKVLEELQS